MWKADADALEDLAVLLELEGLGRCALTCRQIAVRLYQRAEQEEAPLSDEKVRRFFRDHHAVEGKIIESLKPRSCEEEPGSLGQVRGDWHNGKEWVRLRITDIPESIRRGEEPLCVCGHPNSSHHGSLAGRFCYAKCSCPNCDGNP